MPSISPTALDATDADLRNRRREAVKRAISALQASPTEEDVSLDTLDQTIAILKDARNLSNNGNSPEASRQPSPPNNAAQSSSANNRRGHKRNTSDQYAPDNLTVWMRLRHTAKPSRGYRVQYEGAWTTVTTIGGLQASSIFPNPSRGFTDAKLKQLTSEHLDWNSCQGSPFISIFTDQNHAEDWALKWSERNGGKVASLLVIDCNKITRLLSVREVVRQLGIETTRNEMVPEQYEDEYVAINQIPTEAIIENRPIFSQAALDAAAALSDPSQQQTQPTSGTNINTKLSDPQPDPDHVRRFSPVRMNERRSLILENGVQLDGDYLNRGFSSEQSRGHSGVSPV